MIIAKAPHRVSLFGGGTDLPEWYLRHGGAVLGMAIAQYCYVSLRRLPPYSGAYVHRLVYSRTELVNHLSEIDHPAIRGVLQDAGITEGLEVHHFSDVPHRAGLGSSSAFTVALLLALAAHHGRIVSKDDLAREGIRLEREVIGEAGGHQDQVWSSFGGLARIDFDAAGPHHRPLILPPGRATELMRHLLLLFTGSHRIAAEVEARKIKGLSRAEAEMGRIAALVDEGERVLTADGFDPAALGALLDESWRLKRGLTSGVSTSEIDELYATGLRAGAYGGKLLGAGGGGCLLFCVPPDRREGLKAALGLVEIPLRVDWDGAKIVVYEPNGLGSA